MFKKNHGCRSAGVLILFLGLLWVQELSASTLRPNVVIIFCDDLGYGDLACYGHPTIRTPNLDRMAREGQRWTSFYVGASVCTPSRAALLTGRLPIRNGMCGNRRVLFPDSAGGLPAEEWTIAEMLRQVGYKTSCVGKWHLGHLPQYLPTTQGFDHYFGIPYSNDMDRVAGAFQGRDGFWDPKSEYWDVPLLRDTQVVERPANQNTITRRYTEEVVRFIKSQSESPFFVYLAHSMPHVPLFASARFRGQSLRGLYGDVIEEIDWSVGQILDTLDRQGISEDTLVMFTSDNGPWLVFDQHGGSAGLLREGKGSTWEGGMREPALFWWPGTIRPSIVRGLGTTMDIMPSLAAITGATLPADHVLDGVDLSAAWFQSGPSPRDTVYYYRQRRLYAVRKGPFKAHFVTQPAYQRGGPVEHDPPLLFHLEHDPSERFNVADEYPDELAEIQTVAKMHLANMEPGDPQLEKRIQD